MPLQLFVLTVLPLAVLLLAIAVGSVLLHQRAMRSLVGERDELAARAAAAAITEQLNHRAAAVRSLALQAVATNAPEHTLADAASFLPDFEGGLALFAPNGTLLAASNKSDMWRDQSVSQRLIGTGQTNNPQYQTRFLPTFTDPDSGELMMFVIATAPNGFTAAGAFYPSSLARRALTDIFSARDQTAAFVVSANGQLLHRVGNPAWLGRELKQHPGVVEALRGRSGTTYLSVEGNEHVIAFSPIAPVNWVLVIEEPWRAMADPILRTTEIAPLILAPVLITALAGLWFGMRQIVQPLQSLEKKATELAWGDFKAIEEPVGGIDEIQRLQTELVHMAQKVKAAQQSLRGYLGAITTGQEEERRRLARELHDDTIQSLIALNQRVQLAQLSLNGQPAVAQLVEVQQMTTQIIADLRRLTRDLRPIYLEDLGLAPALSMLARDTGAILRVPVNFHMSGTERRLRPEVELALYRIAQEALSNVARHAQASMVAVRLDFAPDAVALTISDNGRGFAVPESPAEMAPLGHFGLLGLHERAELVGAHLALESTPGRGTQVVVTLPV